VVRKTVNSVYLY